MSDELLKIQILPARPEDAGPVMSLLRRTEFFRPAELEIAGEVFDDGLRCGPEGEYKSFVAIEGHKAIGWICFGPTPCTIGTFDIYWLAVDPEKQNRQAGTRLVQHATSMIQSCGGRMIVVDTSGSGRYLSTRRFYEKLGYLDAARIKDFYAPGDDKIIYVRQIL